MDYKDLGNFGQQVGQKIRDAVESFDFEKLNQEIRQNADDVISGVKRSFNDYNNSSERQKHQSQGHHSSFGSFGDYHSENWQTYKKVHKEQCNGDFSKREGQGRPRPSAAWEASKQKPGKKSYTLQEYGFPVERCPKGETSGLLLTIFGSIGFGLSALSWIASGIGALMGSWVSAAAFGGSTLLVLVFIMMMLVGTHQRKRVKRFRRYILAMKGKSFTTIKNLSSLTGKTDRYTIRDVSKMLKLGYFPQGHIDSHKTCLMVTDAIYQQYMETMKNAQSVQKTDKRTDSDKTAGEAADNGRELKELEALGRRYMDIVRKANDDIPDVEISNKLYRMEMIIGKIFEHVKKYPQKADRLSQFQDYYMPMTIKLVETYRDLDGQPIEGENIKKVKQEIEGTLDTINEAYEKLYDSMYQETVMDVSSDISVLRTLLAREGLTKGAFDKKDKS